MAAIVKFFSASLVVLSFLNGALAECTLSDIAVHQQETGSWIHGKMQYEVTVTNNCICSQSSLLLACEGFQSTYASDPSIFQQIDGTTNCSLNNGQPVFQGYPIKFKYAWDETFDLRPVSSRINCS